MEQSGDLEQPVGPALRARLDNGPQAVVIAALDSLNPGTTTGNNRSLASGHGEHHQDLAAAVEAVQAELGTNPSGTAPTVAEAIVLANRRNGNFRHVDEFPGSTPGARLKAAFSAAGAISGTKWSLMLQPGDTYDVGSSPAEIPEGMSVFACFGTTTESASGPGVVNVRHSGAAEATAGVFRPAADAGFCDQSHMHRVFRRVLARTPADVRADRAIMRRSDRP